MSTYFPITTFPFPASFGTGRDPNSGSIFHLASSLEYFRLYEAAAPDSDDADQGLHYEGHDEHPEAGHGDGSHDDEYDRSIELADDQYESMEHDDFATDGHEYHEYGESWHPEEPRGEDEVLQHSDAQTETLWQPEVSGVITIKPHRSFSTKDDFRFLLEDGSFADGDLVDAGEVVVAQYELGRRGWKLEGLDRDETLSVQELMGEAFIVKSELERDGSYEFEVYSDLDGDGIWEEVLEGRASIVDAPDGSVDLVGLVASGQLSATMLGI
jgi:hypothetical protein